MHKLLITLLVLGLVPLSFAISLGDTLNEQVAIQTNSTTITTKIITNSDKFSTFQTTSNHGQIKMLVNNRTHRIYSMTWDDTKSVSLPDILGSTYYPEFQEASKHPQMRIPRRAISIDNGDLMVHQFGSMLSGIHGTAIVKSLSPK